MVAGHNILFIAAEVEAAKATEGMDFEDVEVGRFFGFVGGESGVGGGLDFHDVEGLAGEEHVAMAHAVNELDLEGGDVANDLTGDDAGFEAVGLVEAEGVEDSGASGADFALAGGVDFEEAVETFDDLHAGGNGRCFEGDIGDTVDFDTGGDFDPEGGVAREGEEAARDGAEKSGMLGLETI